jgi:hypothetical protein
VTSNDDEVSGYEILSRLADQEYKNGDFAFIKIQSQGIHMNYEVIYYSYYFN